MSSECYNPDVFRPKDTPLLAKGQWSMVQLFLVDAAHLPLTTKDFPDENALSIFRKIHDASASFESAVLPKSQTTGSTLYNYGYTAEATFKAVVGQLEKPTPDRSVLTTLIGSLSKTAADAKTAAGDVFAGTKNLVDELSRQKPLLQKVVDDEVNSTGGLKSQIAPLQLDIEAQRSIITAAQTAITQDQKVIHDTVYYAWIPLIGAIVALAETISSQNDIQSQLQRIQTAVQQIAGDNGKIQPLQSRMNQLIYAQGFNNDQIAQITQVLPVLQLIEGAWSTVNEELETVKAQIVSVQDPSTIPCLAEVALTTAADEWHDIANDAHDYMTNFYVTSPAAAGAGKRTAPLGTMLNAVGGPTGPGSDRRPVVWMTGPDYRWETILVDRYRTPRGSAVV